MLPQVTIRFSFQRKTCKWNDLMASFGELYDLFLKCIIYPQVNRKVCFLKFCIPRDCFSAQQLNFSRPHELFFRFNRKSMFGCTLPTCLSKPGAVLLRNFNLLHKNDDLVRKVEFTKANPTFN